MTTATRRPLVEVLHTEQCPHLPTALALVEQVQADLRVDAEVHTSTIADQQAAERARFLGSPTIRVDGHDIEPDAERRGDYAHACRLYRTADGQPEARWLRAALLATGENQAIGPLLAR
jgi:hypothetical protein